ncbi:hypothetical protein D9615_006743 [Tricholomella constricta]|uniref:Glucose-methanol-choline oxidoreductase N-terminal domain-containing protein n=1 Tax=Tricholomella constricta TaxID=117010 RepID=A0A8H5H761_9AGAR|nr:hypothetical protein D9615_006743 [Tricholomella constricta]
MNYLPAQIRALRAVYLATVVMFGQLKRLGLFAVLTVLVAHPSVAAIVERAEDLPGLEYDFIIVGGEQTFTGIQSRLHANPITGGTAGLVVANRLSENPNHSVLVIEAGGSNLNLFNSKVPFFNGRLFKTRADWNYTTAAMAGLGGRSMNYPQGHVLGGTSTMNGLAYTRGSSDNYDQYAKLTKDTGWSWNNIQPYLRKNERWTEPADHHNTTGQFDPAVHGFQGINAVSLPGFMYAFDHRVIQATSELPGEFPFNLDMNSGNQIGIGWTQSTIKGGERSSSATSYLAPRFVERKNLHVLIHARVTRVLQTGKRKGLPVFKGVEFTCDANSGPRRKVTARKEVILSGGAVGTPHILQHSGIGDSTLLSKVGVKPLVHLPSVGQNLTDHPFVANTWLVNSTDTFETALRNSTIMEQQVREWNETRTGPYAASTFNVAGWLRVPGNATIFHRFRDPSAGPRTAHFEFIIANGMTRLPLPPTGNFMVIGTVVLTPLSRGTVLISSNDPFDPPTVNPNLMDSDFDMFVMREAIRSARRFAQAPVFSDYVFRLEDTAVTDTELDSFIRRAAITVSHAVGTASMSPKGANYGVVDPDLRVKKVRGLRVVDASVIPLVPAAHTQAATMSSTPRCMTRAAIDEATALSVDCHAWTAVAVLGVTRLVINAPHSVDNMLALVFRRPVIRFARLYSTCIADTPPLKEPGKRMSRKIQTLNRDLLTASDFVDLSHLRHPSIQLHTGSAQFRYMFSNHGIGKPFPPNTRGFLYWHHDPSLPPTSAGIRFRLVPEPDPNLFSTGTDLLYPNAMPWSIDLVKLDRQIVYASIKAKLITDRLVDTASFESLEKRTANHKWNSTFIHKLDQPFALDIASQSNTILIISPTRWGKALLPNFIRDWRASVRSVPYTGRILVRFELSPFPEHARPAPRPPVIVLRVLKILSPIKVILPQYDMYVPMPVEGALLEKKIQGGLSNRVFSIDLERAAKYHRDLNILVDVTMLTAPHVPSPDPHPNMHETDVIFLLGAVTTLLNPVGPSSAEKLFRRLDFDLCIPRALCSET